MSSEVITRGNERIKTLLGSLDKVLVKLENILTNYKPTLNGERFLTDVQVSERLKVSRRTLQQYRSEGRIPYFRFGGKSLYRESDIQKILEKNYCEEWE
ncbi:helix-turn-helix domain-containing protein [Dysgonomonas sp. BGC7]|uniref:helix-turn-helix domain-containing protein n=1 Tax=Dysgonomonas sp. BGC7 TaxID=1658008 RepID=UPI00067FFA92|nr:helix-turn-helix domain-containing protein [Dysgonomonas sp. BGC7]MBD8390390.1 helix-turn-helix domain-containing protein [Dysgonomonas sp. BGC7]